MKKNERMNNKGFSLVELIIVIAIMAVLIAVLAPSLFKYVEKSRQSKDITNLDTCVSAAKIYYTDREMTDDITIEADSTGELKSSDSNACLVDANCTGSMVEGAWDSSDPLKAVINKTTGEVTYSGESEYYECDGSQYTPK